LSWSRETMCGRAVFLRVAGGTAAVCGRGASAQTTSVVQIARNRLIGVSKKSPASKTCGAGVRGEGWPIPPLFGRLSFETNAFGPLGSALLFSSADYCERGKCVPAVFGVGVAPDEEPRSGSSSSAHESTNGRSTNYGSGDLIRVVRDIGRIVS
jgi:hypothetical protein